MTPELWFEAGGLVAVIVGLWFAGVQFKQGRLALEHTAQSHEEEYLWRRKIAAQEALASYSSSVVLSDLQKQLNYLEIGRRGCIDLDELEQKLEASPDLRADLHRLLNYYEALARGVLQGLYDDEVIKAGRRGAMNRAYSGFECYIVKRRDSGSPNAWIDFETLIRRWDEADGKEAGMIIEPRLQSGSEGQ